MGSQRQWVVIGGSYPGALSAWFKYLYPDSAVAAWSSSGVINAIEDYRQYDLDIYESTMRMNQTCTQAIADLTSEIDQIFFSAPSQ